MSNLTVERIGYSCGARVTGVDVSKPLSDAVMAQINQAWLEHLVLVFPKQTLNPQTLVTFTKQFGELDDYATQPFNRDRKSTRLNSSHSQQSRMPSSA